MEFKINVGDNEDTFITAKVEGDWIALTLVEGANVVSIYLDPGEAERLEAALRLAASYVAWNEVSEEEPSQDFD